MKNSKLIFDLEEIPSEISGVTLTDAVRELLSYGNESPLLEGFIMDDGDIRNAKIRMIRSASGEAEVGFTFQREQLIIPEIIGDYKLSEEDKVRLINREVAGPAKINGTEVFLQVDNELNSVTVKSANDISIKELIVLRHSKNGFEIAGQKLDDNEVRQLIEGKELDTKIYEQDGKLFSARVSLTEDDKGIRFREILTLTPLQAKELQWRLNKRKILESNTINAPVEAGINVVMQEQINNSKQTKETELSTDRVKLVFIAEQGYEGIKSYYDWEGLFNKDFMNKYNLTHSFNRAYDEHNVATFAKKDDVRDSSLKLVEKYSLELKKTAAKEVAKLDNTINQNILNTDREKLQFIAEKGYVGIGERHRDFDDTFMGKYNLADTFNKVYEEDLRFSSAETSEPDRASSLKIIEKYSIELKEIASNELEKLPLGIEPVFEKTQIAISNSEYINNLDSEVYSSIENKDFKKLYELKKGGYTPTEVMINKIDSNKSLTPEDKAVVKVILGIETLQKEVKGEKNKDVCPKIKIASAETEKKPEVDFYKVKSIIQSFGGDC